MTPLIHAIDLQAARKAASERFYRIGMAYLPEGYTYKFRKSLWGAHWGERKHIDGPKPLTRKALYIWLHECAHAHLHASPEGKRKTRHVQEMETEKWAHEKMRFHGVPVPKAMTERSIRYVDRKIDEAVKRGAKHIDPEAAKYAKKGGK